MKKILQNINHNFALIGLLLVLSIPILDRKLHFLPTYADTEKRELAARPLYSLKRPIEDLLKEFSAYWSDNFGGRSMLLHWRGYVWSRLAQVSPVPSVVIGKDGWLFYESQAKDDGPGISDYQGRARLSDTELAGIASSLQTVSENLAQRNIKLIVVVAPNKSTIYPDKLPGNLAEQVGATRLDQVSKIIPESVSFVDPRQDLISSRTNLDTYYQTDSHWNNYGAYLVVNSILAKLNLPINSLQSYAVENKVVKGEGDLASMMAARGIFDENDIYFHHIKISGIKDYDLAYLDSAYLGHVWENPDIKLPRLVLYGDSYRNSMAPFLIPHFSTSYIMGYSSNFKVNYQLIDEVGADVVIWEVAERYIDRLDQTLKIKI